MALSHICYTPGCRKVVTSTRPCPDHPRQSWARGRSRQERGYDAEYVRNRAIVMGRAASCAGCGAPAQATDSCDHRTPRHRGGTNEVSNLRRLCAHCHGRKTAQESRDGLAASRA